MLGDARKDPDEELVDNFLRSPDPREWRIWADEESGEPHLDPETYSAFIRVFPMMPEIKVRVLYRFERNNIEMTTRGKLTYGGVSLPALELTFQDPDFPGATWVGFIEGRKNINNFLKKFVQKYVEQSSLPTLGG